MCRDYDKQIDDFKTKFDGISNVKNPKINVEKHTGMYFHACLNDIQQNKNKDEYLELMLKMEKVESIIRNENEDNSIDDVIDDNEIIRKYFNNYLTDQNTDQIVNFLKKNGHVKSKNFIEEDINKKYDILVNKPLDVFEFDQEFKDNLMQHQFKSNLEYKPDNIHQYLKDANFDKSLTDREGDTLMTAACQYGDEDTVFEMLQRSDIDLNQPDDNGNTPFILACKNNPDLAVELLGHQNIDLNTQNEAGETGFHCAVMDQPELATALMDCEAIDVNKPDNEGITPFMMACRFCRFSDSNKDCVYKMLKNDNVDLNTQDKDGNTAFMHACICDDDRYINGNRPSSDDFNLAYEMSQNKKIDIDIKNNKGKTAFDYLDFDEAQHVKQSIQDRQQNEQLKKSMNTKQAEEQKSKTKKNKNKLL